MDTSDLSGIVVVIDDQVEEEDTNIYNLVKNIKKAPFPCLTYNDIPELETVPHLSSAPFIVLDWQLYSDSATSQIKKQKQEDLLKFIAKLKESCFCPIFVYTNEDVDVVKNILLKAKLIDDSLNDVILIRHKTDLKPEKVIEAFNEWAQKNPTVHTLLKWEKIYEHAKNSLFSEFYALSHAWPKVLWDTYKGDGVDPSEELGNMITRNLHSRMRPFKFDDHVFSKEHESSKDELRKVLSGEKFLENLREDTIRSGDVFRIGKHCYINIRPDCDCVVSRNPDDTDLYLLKLESMSARREQAAFSEDRGNFNERSDESVVFNMFNQKTYSVKFKHVKIVKWSECKDSRKGRLLAPYITRVLQRYSLYIQREGIPKIPAQAVFDKSAKR